MKIPRSRPLYVNLPPKLRAQLDLLLAERREEDHTMTMTRLVRDAVWREIEAFEKKRQRVSR